jgi:release factor glutamine methyltransferase
MRIAQALSHAAGGAVGRLDAQRLLLAAMGRDPHDRAWLLAHDTDWLSAAEIARFDAFCRRLQAGEPMGYLLGWQDFHGLTLLVDERVLVPRPDTETLVDWALERLGPAASLLDLGTGSGAIALAVKEARPDVVVEAVDTSEDALAVARGNAARLRLDVCFRAAHWLNGAGHYDVVVSNPPYIAENDPHLPALAHEPPQALVAGPDGLKELRHIITEAPSHLAPGGWLLLEHGWNQAVAVRGLLAEAGFAEVGSRRDLADIERCSGGRWLELG